MINTLLELFRANFFLIDFIIGGTTPIAVYFLYRTGRIDKFIWILFWLGFALGLTWEIPMSALTTFSETNPVHFFIREIPVHFTVWIVMHSFWDGGLFLLGVLLVYKICGGPVFERFRISELAVLVLWGQVSELWVETTSILGEAWVYIPRPWNPVIFKFMGHDVTLMVQIIWLVATIVFYFAALFLRSKYPAPSKTSPD